MQMNKIKLLLSMKLEMKMQGERWSSKGAVLLALDVTRKHFKLFVEA